MTENTRARSRGFTLVELMIVVAIIGVLAALAIYGVRKYLAASKTSEAKNTLGAISRAAANAYERETTASQLTAEGSSSSAASRALCANAIHVPSTIAPVTGKKYQPNTSDGKDFETGDGLTGWKCLKFSISQPISYQYAYQINGASVIPGAPAFGAGSFVAEAFGDLDADGVGSGFVRGGTINATTGELILTTQVHSYQEFE